MPIQDHPGSPVCRLEYNAGSPAMLNGPKFVQVSDVARVFSTPDGAVRALDAVSFDARAGEFLSIVGPSGCGKSTLVMIVAGLLAPTQGVVSVAGQPVDRPQTNLGIVFQSPVLLAWRSALDNVLLQIEMRGEDVAAYRERARELLDGVGLGGFERRLPHELSGGMRQRVSICRALIHDPPLLLMDEPFGALDALTRDQMTLDIQRFASGAGQRFASGGLGFAGGGPGLASGEQRAPGPGPKTVLFITHSITEAVFLSDRVIVMTPRPGRIDTVIDIDLPRPRRLSLRDDSGFATYTRQIRDRFMAHGVLRDID